MIIYILTSVALFAENGDLDSLGAPSVNVSVHPTLSSAQAQMKTELESEKMDSENAGYSEDDYTALLYDKLARYERNTGDSYNYVDWEITEKEVSFL